MAGTESARGLTNAATPGLLLGGDDGMAAVETLMNNLARGEHDDFCGVIALDHLASGGKRLRAKLALAAAETLGSTREAAIGWAAACELLHNATLIHDDVQDGDRVRRGRPTTWVTFGSANAINAGDLMLMLPTLAVGQVETDDACRWRLCEILGRQASKVIRGQVAELEMTAKADTSWDVYDRAIVGKTSALFELPVVGAAVLSGATAEEARRVATPFRTLGVLFQMQDDVIDLFGDKGRGQPGSDIKEGKVSALVVEHVARHPSERDWIVEILRTPREQTSQETVNEVIKRFDRSGALKGVCKRIERDTELAINAPELVHYPKIQALIAELCNVIVAPIANTMKRFV
ncbi:MAG: polyprenyl synthetase family protein [Clostridia bacterium]|nr:polyprenyl synthetase family protein [Deltaproteobacteria bacterium]